jgi:hypothetical protein
VGHGRVPFRCVRTLKRNRAGPLLQSVADVAPFLFDRKLTKRNAAKPTIKSTERKLHHPNRPHEARLTTSNTSTILVDCIRPWTTAARSTSRRRFQVRPLLVNADTQHSSFTFPLPAVHCQLFVGHSKHYWEHYREPIAPKREARRLEPTDHDLRSIQALLTR